MTTPWNSIDGSFRSYLKSNPGHLWLNLIMDPLSCYSRNSKNCMMHGRTDVRTTGVCWSKNNNKFTCGLVRELVEVKPIWQGDPISVMKSFRTRSCRLCNEERIQILKTRNRQPNNVINTRIDLMRGCHHTPKFHRYSHL